MLGRPCIQLKGKRDTQTCQTPSAKNLGEKRDLEPPPLLTLLGVLSGVREKQQTGRERGSAKRLLVLVLVLALVVRPKPTRKVCCLLSVCRLLLVVFACFSRRLAELLHSSANPFSGEFTTLFTTQQLLDGFPQMTENTSATILRWETNVVIVGNAGRVGNAFLFDYFEETTLAWRSRGVLPGTQPGHQPGAPGVA